MKRVIQDLWLYLKYERNFLMGKTFQGDYLPQDEWSQRVYAQLLEAFQDYDPGERDYMKNVYQRAFHPVPSELALRKQAAQMATEVIILVEMMHAGQLPPNTFMPLIKPSDVTYYQQRIHEYLNWLFSTDLAERKRPLPFFYTIASERLKQSLMPAAETMPAEMPAQAASLLASLISGTRQLRKVFAQPT